MRSANSTLGRIVGVLIGLAFVARVGAVEPAGAPPEAHRFAAYTLPLNGAWNGNDLVVDRADMPGPDGTFEPRWTTRASVLADWKLATFPAGPFEGMSNAGVPLVVTIESLEEPEGYAPYFKLKAHERQTPARDVEEHDVALVWTGHLDLQLVKSQPAILSPLDAAIALRECQARGLEMRLRLGDAPALAADWGAEWFDELDDEARLDVADPLLEGNTELVPLAPYRASNAILVGCSFKLVSDPDRRVRGPALLYDLIQHRVERREPVDFDDHLSFVRIGNDVLMLQSSHSNAGETFGWWLTEFFEGTDDWASFGDTSIGAETSW